MNLEAKLDAEFAKLGVKPYIFHFTDVEYFKGITIVDTKQLAFKETLNHLICDIYYDNQEQQPSTALMNQLKKYDLFGISICNHRDNFSRRRGRIIAKGRLLKHLLQREAEEAYPTIISPTSSFANRVEYGKEP